MIFNDESDRTSKTYGLISDDLLKEVCKKEICNRDFLDANTKKIPKLLSFKENDIKNNIPPKVLECNPNFVVHFTEDINLKLPGGLTPTTYNAILEGIQYLFQYVIAVKQSGHYTKIDKLYETNDFQKHIKETLLMQRLKITEGAEIGGGETDLILSDSIIIENKVLKESSDPLNEGEYFSWQARRYSIAIARNFAFEMVAYKPKDENAILPYDKCVSVKQISDKNKFLVIRFVVPYGYDVPSHAKAPE